MPLFINTNVTSLNSQRHMVRNQHALSKSFERLSSGLRINSASDDTAGLAIANRMGAQIRSLNMAVRNANDGVSLLQTAESALGESAAILERMRELAVQATNDTNTDADRQSLQTEVAQLASELTRVGDDTEFNTLKLLDGSDGDGWDFQVGFKKGQSVNVQIEDSRGSYIGGEASVTATNGVDDTANNSGANSIALVQGDLIINGTSVGASSAHADVATVGGRTAGSATQKAVAINLVSGLTGVTATAEASVLTGSVASITANTAVGNNDFFINGIDIGAVTWQAADGDGSLRDAINAKTAEHGTVATIGTGGNLVLTAADGRDIHVDTAGNAVAAITADNTKAYGKLTLSSDKDFFVGSGTNNADANAGFQDAQLISHAYDSSGSVDQVNVGSKSGADDALAVIDRAINQVAGRRGELGSLQNRMASTISNLMSVSENLTAAQSRIQDADFAVETANMTKSQIIQQASVSMLAQANSAPQAVLALLG